jgi:hypothetical protein
MNQENCKRAEAEALEKINLSIYQISILIWFKEVFHKIKMKFLPIIQTKLLKLIKE